jgi:2'-5' RNA ligase
VRLFVGVRPSDEARRALAAFIAEARAAWPVAKWVPPENVHLTLAFLGEIAETEVPRLSASMDEAVADLEPFPAALGRFGRFPRGGKARVLWVGIEEGAQELEQVARAVWAGIAPWYEPEDRPFAAHLTVARFRKPYGIDEEKAPELVRTGPWSVDRVELMSSKLMRPAPVYTVVHSARLGGGAP